MNGAQTPAGWYPDPQNAQQHRYWDGTRWTEQVAPRTAPPPPPPGRSAPTGDKPSSYLAWAIVTTILCCLPFGIVSIVYAAKVDGAWASGDTAEAQRCSTLAKRWAWASASFGIAVAAVWVIVAVTAAMSEVL